MNFSTNLRYLRKKYNMTQEYLADKLGYKSFTTIQKWESGISEPSISTVRTIADMFNVTMNQLINEDIAEPPEAPAGIAGDEQVLLGFYRELNDEGKEKLVDYADDLCSSGKYKKHCADAVV